MFVNVELVVLGFFLSSVLIMEIKNLFLSKLLYLPYCICIVVTTKMYILKKKKGL